MPQTGANTALQVRINSTNETEDQNTRWRCHPYLECQVRHRGQRASYLGSFCLYGYFWRSPRDSEGSRGLSTFHNLCHPLSLFSIIFCIVIVKVSVTVVLGDKCVITKPSLLLPMLNVDGQCKIRQDVFTSVSRKRDRHTYRQAGRQTDR